tara:strand:+ start:3140 stop:4036 length:897 start_codon:yes stop_codon:yes gene_type:complete
MNILVAVDNEVADSLIYWLHSQGHHTHTDSTTLCQKLVLDYSHLKPYLHTKQPLPGHWPTPEHWLLLDAYLEHAQLISIMHMGCKHISLTPIHAVHLQQWLYTQPQIISLACDWPVNYEPEAETEPLLLPFIDCIAHKVWTDEEQQAAVKLIAWRNVALQSAQYQHLNESSKLDTVEFSQLANHTLAGHSWLEKQANHKAALIAHQHHEHWDGTGYPMAISGEAICFEARVAKLYDSYVGLRKDKPYAKACDHRTSVKKLAFGDGYLSPSHFDPHLLKRFLAAEKTIELHYNSVCLDN